MNKSPDVFTEKKKTKVGEEALKPSMMTFI